MPRVSIADCQLFFERRGSGPTVMLVSGLGGLASFWEEQVPSLARAFDIVTHDHRGIGQSDRVRMAYSVEQMTADVLGLMNALGIAQAHVVRNFIAKLEDVQVSWAFLVAAQGVTGSGERNTRAHAAIQTARTRKVNLLVVTRAEIEALPEQRALCLIGPRQGYDAQPQRAIFLD